MIIVGQENQQLLEAVTSAMRAVTQKLGDSDPSEVILSYWLCYVVSDWMLLRNCLCGTINNKWMMIKLMTTLVMVVMGHLNLTATDDIVELVLFVGHFCLFYGSTKIDVSSSVHGQVLTLH